MSLSHMSHNVSLVPHQFTHPKLNSCPSSPNQTFTQAFWSGGTVTYPAPQTRNLEVILSNSLSNSLQILSYLTISTSTRIIQATSISYLELLPYPPTDFLNFILVVVVQSLSCVWLFVTPWTAACQAPLSSTISHSLLRFMSMKSMMLSKHLIFCHSLLLLPSVFPSVRVFSNELALHIRNACPPRNHFILTHFQSHSYTTAKWITMCDLEPSFW